MAFFLDPGRFDLNYFLGARPMAGLLDAVRSNGGAGLLAALGRQPPKLLGLLLLVVVANSARLLLAARALRQPATKQVVAADWLRLDTRAGRLVVLALLLYLALLMGPLGAARFLVPGYPLLLALALRGW